MPLVAFLALTLLLPAVIVIGNFVIGVLTPITLYFPDDITLIDPVWRLVQGQHLGTDFHDPRGFGLFQVAAMLWRLLGPHYYVLRVSADLFALVIVLCGSVVAMQQLRDAAGLAALFCITVALEASGPTIYGSAHDFGMACSYNRLLMSGLLVLFVQSFANDLDSRHERNYIAYFTAAFLLNILFLVKISGLVLGLVIVVGGYIVRSRFSRNLGVAISLILLFLAVMVAIDFVITGTSLLPVLQEYRLAAQARTESYSVLDALWFASGLRILGVVVLMALYAVSRRPDSGESLRRCFFIIAFYWVCQVVLNMSNWPFSFGFIILAPAAAVAVVTWTETSDTVAAWDHLWSRFHPRRLHEISAREVIPPLILALVLVPEALASLRAVKLVSISAGAAKPIITVTANKGITFDVMESYENGLALSLNRAIQEIEALRASHDKIANLDFMNPFPALFLAPAPKGVSVFWNFGFNVPIGYRPSWQEIIGDACIITEPKQSSEPKIVDAVRPHLTSAFTLVHQDEFWKIWKHNGGCAD